MVRHLIIGLALCAVAACGAERVEREIVILNAQPTLNGEDPVIIAHRGASGRLPEHTLEAYGRAMDAGAHFIEPDLVMTRDGVLVARHDRYLSTTTNVAELPEFADRRTTKELFFGPRDDWFVEDFTLAELKRLRARQPRDGRPISYNDRFEIPTFDEILDEVVTRAEDGQVVGVYPEIKSPAFFAEIGLSMEAPLLEAIRRAGLAELGVPVFLQSFEPAVLRSLSAQTDWPLVQLLTASERALEFGYNPDLAEIAEYADGVGPDKSMLWLESGEPSGFVAEAHRLGLEVHPYTFRDDDVGAGFDTVEQELRATLAQGVDGVFVDYPETAVRLLANES